MPRLHGDEEASSNERARQRCFKRRGVAFNVRGGAAAYVTALPPPPPLTSLFISPPYPRAHHPVFSANSSFLVLGGSFTLASLHAIAVSYIAPLPSLPVTIVLASEGKRMKRWYTRGKSLPLMPVSAAFLFNQSAMVAYGGKVDSGRITTTSLETLALWQRCIHRDRNDGDDCLFRRCLGGLLQRENGADGS